MTSPEDTQAEQSPASVDFNLLANRVFSEEKGQLLIGGRVMDKLLRDSLREEAKVIEVSRLWETLEATILQEASTMALIQSKDMEHVNIAKMLYHWSYVFKNMIHKLSKE